MRFKLFGFKGNISILDRNKDKKKKAPKDDGDSTITCLGYRTFTEFDQPPIPPRRDVSNQASTSTFKTNGDLSYKTGNSSKTSTPFAKVTNGHISNSKLKDTNKAVSASQPELVIRRSPAISHPISTPSIADKRKATEISPVNFQENPAVNKQEQATNDTSVAAANEGLIAAQSLPNLNYGQRNVRFEYIDDDDDDDEDDEEYYDDEEIRNQSDNGALTVVAGQTTKARDNDDNERDNGKKSTLIFMTEDHDNRDSDEYEDDDSDNYYGRESKYPQTKEYDREGVSKSKTNDTNEYSNQAASIFFNDSVPEPEQRQRTFKYRDDDDNGSQTSA